MPSLATVRQSNANFSPPTPPVAIFLGGTSGIGQGTAQAFARHTKGNAHIIIIGRNRVAAEAIVETFPKAPGSKYEFVYCDASLIRNVAQTTSALISRLPKVNYMVLTSGGLPSLWDMVRGVQHPTEEGLDNLLAIVYYARTKFILDLLPLLQKAKDAGEDSRVLTVAAAGHGGPINYNDMGLKKTYSVRTVRPTMVTYVDMAMETFSQSLALRVPGATFTHIYPGAVSTPLFPRWTRPLADLLATSIDDCGEYMLYALLNGGEGAQRKGEHGDDLGPESYHGGDEVRDRVWTHTMEVFDRALVAAGSAKSGVNV
ncbi:NAD(P)-binding protein [Daedalea quercina L-15889]|uniref:NAD(P)-binding protein n=1 Tax=Daedalea quercina L-15889 TaxID=1314783 RepID=A0A165Q7N5_9APHY|nr:NAD(P)-binding protein [Daedalea quercina L-15889]